MRYVPDEAGIGAAVSASKHLAQLGTKHDFLVRRIVSAYVEYHANQGTGPWHCVVHPGSRAFAFNSTYCESAALNAGAGRECELTPAVVLGVEDTG